ncbi:MAG: EamA family transporter, partial [Planctomycetes bacterium]|nr:EamA family transporter [Planctomycetota bacterium]
MPILLSLCAALSFGASDFFGGLASRRAPVLSVVLVVQLTGLALLALSAPWTVPHFPDATTLGWGVVAGLTGGMAALTLYPALAIGSASEVAPLSAVIGTALPILFGLALGERPSPSAWLGIALAGL